MEKYLWFYVLVMLAMIVVVAIELKLTKGRDFLNWLQLFIYVVTIAWFAFCLIGILPSTWFFLGTSVAYVLALAVETWQCAANAKREILDYVFLIVGFIPVFLSLGILSGIIA